MKRHHSVSFALVLSMCFVISSFYSYASGVLDNTNADFSSLINDKYSGGILSYNERLNSGFVLVDYSRVDFSMLSNNLSDTAGIATGGAIENSDSITMRINGYVTFDSNSSISKSYDALGGAIFNSGSVSLLQNENVAFSSNSTSVTRYSSTVYTYANGGAIYNDANSTFLVNNNGDVIFASNSTTGRGPASGGAIYNNSAFKLNDNECVCFKNNAASILTGDGGAVGGAIWTAKNGLFEMCNNKEIVFAGNNAITGNNLYYGESAAGGAIYSASEFLMMGNEKIVFSDNFVSGTSSARGGAVHLAPSAYDFYGRTQRISDNGDICFINNSVSSFTRAEGGAMYNGDTSDQFYLNNNGNISFCNNSASATALLDGNTVYARGGAIFNSSSLILSDNEGVLFSGNRVLSNSVTQNVYGGAIYSYHGNKIVISGNDNVLFEKNVEINNGTYRLRSIYSEAGQESIFLSADIEKSITFRDSVFAENSVYINCNGERGDIVFTGATTESDLREVKGGIDGTVLEINNSRTSQLSYILIKGGRLIVEEDAILRGHGIKILDKADAEICLNNGVIDETGYDVSVSSGSGLMFSGENRLSASNILLADKSCLQFDLDAAKTMVDLDANLTIDGNLGLIINYLNESLHEKYELLSMKSWNRMTGWNAANLTISGASEEHLVWEGNTLYYRPLLVQENGDTTLDNDVDTDAEGGTIGGKDDVSIDGNGHTLTVKNEVQLVQMALKNGIVKLEGENNGIVSVTLTEGGELVLTAGAGLKTGDIISMVASGKGELVISGDITIDSKGMKGKARAQATVSHADMQVQGDASISHVRVEDSTIDLAEGSTVGFEHVVLAATTRITDDPATANLDDVTAELVMGVNTSLTGSDLLLAGTSLAQSGNTGVTLTLSSDASVLMLEATTFDSLTLSGSTLVLELEGMTLEMFDNAELIAVSFTSGTDYATFDKSLAVTLSVDGINYERGYTMEADDTPTTMYFRGGKKPAPATPEPATTTLSLLALTALAARRKRK